MDYDDRKKRRAFYSDLDNFLKKRCSINCRGARIDGKTVDLYELYHKVVSLGGWSRVTYNDKWKDIVQALNLPVDTCGIELALKGIYARYLLRFHQLKTFGENHDDAANGSNHLLRLNRNKSSLFNLSTLSSPLSHKKSQGDHSRHYESALNVQSIEHAPFVKLVRSLQSGLPNEIDLAINVCLLISSSTNVSKVNFKEIPSLIELLLAHAGFFRESETSYKHLYLHDWRRQHKEYPLKLVEFWHESMSADCGLDDGAFNVLLCTDELSGSKFTKCTSSAERTLFNLATNEYNSTNNIVLQRIKQIANVLRNFTFDVNYKCILASSGIMLRYLVTASNCKFPSICSMAWDSLSNLSTEIDLEASEPSCVQLILAMLKRALLSDDKFKIIRALEAIGGLCNNDANASSLLAHFDYTIISRIGALMALKDVMLCVYLLECLYSMSELGEIVCNRVAEHPKIIDNLVHLASVETVTYGQNGLIGMKVVEYGAPRLQTQLLQQQQQPPQAPLTFTSLATQQESYRQPNLVTAPSMVQNLAAAYPQPTDADANIRLGQNAATRATRPAIDRSPAPQSTNQTSIISVAPQQQSTNERGVSTSNDNQPPAPPPPLLSPYETAPVASAGSSSSKQRGSRLLAKLMREQRTASRDGDPLYSSASASAAAAATNQSPPPQLTPANQSALPILSPSPPPVDNGRAATSDDWPPPCITPATPVKRATTGDNKRKKSDSKTQSHPKSDGSGCDSVISVTDSELASSASNFRGPALIMQQNDKTESVALNWLKQNCEVDVSSSVSRAELYSAYVQTISQMSKERLSTMAVSVCAFANLIRQAFPSCQLQPVNSSDSNNCKSSYMQVRGVKFVPAVTSLNTGSRPLSQNSNENANYVRSDSAEHSTKSAPSIAPGSIASQHPIMQQILEQRATNCLPNLNTKFHASNKSADSKIKKQPAANEQQNFGFNFVTSCALSSKIEENGLNDDSNGTALSRDSLRSDLSPNPNSDSLKNLLTKNILHGNFTEISSSNENRMPIDFSSLNTELNISIPSTSASVDASFSLSPRRIESVEHAVSLANFGSAAEKIVRKLPKARAFDFCKDESVRLPNGFVKTATTDLICSSNKTDQLAKCAAFKESLKDHDENGRLDVSTCYSPGPNAERIKLNIDQSLESIHEYLTNTIVAAVIEEMEPERQRLKAKNSVVNDTISDTVDFVTNNSSILEPSPSRHKACVRKSSVVKRSLSDGVSNQGSSTAGSPLSSSTCSSADSPVASVLANLKRSHDGADPATAVKTPRKRRCNKVASYKTSNGSANSKASVNADDASGKKQTRWTIVKPTVNDVVESVASRLATDVASDGPVPLSPDNKVFRPPLPVTDALPTSLTIAPQFQQGNPHQHCPAPQAHFVHIQQQPSTSNAPNVHILRYACEWDRCEKLFDSPNQVAYHCFRDHLPFDENARYLCKWSRCDKYPRRKWSLMSHLQDVHCNERALKMTAIRRHEISINGFTKIPEPRSGSAHPGYPADAAVAAIRRHAFVNLPKDFTEENEGPVTKSLRLASCLTLRNLVRFSAEARRRLKKYESTISWMAFSRLESAAVLAQCLSELYPIAVHSTSFDQEQNKSTQILIQNEQSNEISP